MVKCDVCNLELTEEQLIWENEYANDLCYCQLYKEIQELKERIKELEEDKDGKKM